MQIDIKKILEEEGVERKFQGCAPDGFVLVHEDTLKDLKDFDVWKDWKNEIISIKELNKKNFENTQNWSIFELHKLFLNFSQMEHYSDPKDVVVTSVDVYEEHNDNVSF